MNWCCVFGCDEKVVQTIFGVLFGTCTKVIKPGPFVVNTDFGCLQLYIMLWVLETGIWTVNLFIEFLQVTIQAWFLVSVLAYCCIFFFFFLHCPFFREGCGGQQLAINPPNFTVFHHIHHFAWVKSQAIPSKIFNVIGPSSSRPSNCFFPICFGK